jgi:hypothetical protein
MPTSSMHIGGRAFIPVFSGKRSGGKLVRVMFTG